MSNRPRRVWIVQPTTKKKNWHIDTWLYKIQSILVYQMSLRFMLHNLICSCVLFQSDITLSFIVLLILFCGFCVKGKDGYQIKKLHVWNSIFENRGHTLAIQSLQGIGAGSVTCLCPSWPESDTAFETLHSQGSPYLHYNVPQGTLYTIYIPFYIVLPLKSPRSSGHLV